MHTNYRGSQEWRDEKLPLTTGSNEACKLYDATLTQLVGWYDDENLGGIEGTVKKMMQADEDFVMGQVVKTGLGLLGGNQSVELNKGLRDEVDRMIALGKKTPNLTWREKKHIEAMEVCSHGDDEKAAYIWDEILAQHPTDMLALKFAFGSYLFQGLSCQIRDSVARVFPYWKPNMPFYGNVHGLLAFGFEETNMFQEGEQLARKALSINPRDAWSTHTLCHIMEMQGRQHEGIHMMDSTVQYWEPCNYLASHNYWHLSLYHLNIGDYESALSAFDNEISRRGYKSGSMLGLVDICSFLYRMEIEGQSVGDRWTAAYEAYKHLLHNHVHIFFDLHVLMACLGAGKKEAVQDMMESMQKFVREGKGTNRNTTAKLGENLMKAMVAYDDGDFASAVDLFLPVKANVVEIGASHAQRDVFNLFLIQAAIKSPKKEHHKLARNLLNERKMWKPNAPTADRLMAKILAEHGD